MLNEITNEGKETIYAGISSGRIVVKSDMSDPKAISRINKKGNEVWEHFYANIVGLIKSINVEENIFGEVDIKIGLEFKDKKGLLTFGLDSSYGRSFLAQIFNADVTKPIIFSPWMKVNDDGVKKSRLYLSYDRKSPVEWKLPEGTPEVKWVKTKKGDVIDPVSKAEHDTFLEEKLDAFIKEHNLVYVKAENDVPEGFEDVVAPLTAEEKTELKNLKKTNKKSNKDNGFDDFFDED